MPIFGRKPGGSPPGEGGVGGVKFGVPSGKPYIGFVGQTQNPPKYTVFKTPPPVTKFAPPAPPSVFWDLFDARRILRGSPYERTTKGASRRQIGGCQRPVAA